MEVKIVLNAFKEACIKKDWGEQSYIKLLYDGSGTVVDEDGYSLFDFESIVELLKELTD